MEFPEMHVLVAFIAVAAVLSLVECKRDVCELPKVSGPCFGAFPKYFFNNTETEECELFTYGGCGGNGNRFKTKKDCADRCICNLPAQPGPCLAYIPSYYYNSNTGKCTWFVYGGCGGNANRFETKADCEKICDTA